MSKDSQILRLKRELSEKKERLSDMQALLLVSPYDRCARYNMQDCVNCCDLACDDNLNPLKGLFQARNKELTEARAEVERLKKDQESDAKKIAEIIKGHVEKFYQKDQLIEKLAGALKIAFEDARYTHTIDAIKEALAAYRATKGDRKEGE